jgi:HK97 family phage portal protein
MAIKDSIFRSVFKKQINDLRKAIGSEMYAKLMQNLGGNPVYIGDDMETYINDGYLFNPTVYSIVSFIAQKAGSIPWYVYEVKNEKALRLYKSASPHLGIKRSIVRTKALAQVEGHELEGLFKKPNPLQGWSEFIEQQVGFKLVTGNSYTHCIGPTNGINAGLIKEMWVLPSQIIAPIPGGRMQPVKGYTYRPDQTVTIPAEEVIHNKYWTPEYASGSFLVGLSPIRAGRRVITRSNSSYDASVASFQNMGAYGMITGKPGEAALTDAQAEMIEKRLAKKTGPKNAGKTLVTSADILWQQMGMSPVDMNIIESDKMDLRFICNLFHVPSELFNDAGNKTYSNTKEAGSAVYTNAVIPALTQFRDSFNAFIEPRYKGRFFADFDTSMISELQEDVQYLASALSQCWWVNGNERREIMGFEIDEINPIMNEYMIPAGLFPASQGGVSDVALDESLKMLAIDDYRG